MDYDETQSPEPMNEPPQAELPGIPAPPPLPNTRTPKQKPKRSGWRIFWGIVLGMSVIANVFLFCIIIVIVSVAMSAPGDMLGSRRSAYVEETLIKGPASKKIVVIRLEGIIDRIQSHKFKQQLKAAREDSNVKAVIIRTVTPGGTVSASDQIHHEISKFRKETKKPVVAFMQSIAASGGYYTSVACDKIVAEPTVITGSIGVIMSNLVFKNLLEEKLGIQPVVIKSGEKKDWPSMFSDVTDEQREYLMEKLINPSYNRFVNLVAQGRQGLLTIDEVKKLADGSIFGAEEAMANKLIDDVGYFEKAVSTAEGLAGIKKDGARVVEYARQFSLSMLLGAEAKQKKLIEADINMLHELATPQLMYLWDVRW